MKQDYSSKLMEGFCLIVFVKLLYNLYTFVNFMSPVSLLPLPVNISLLATKKRLEQSESKKMFFLSLINI
jgi:hypothetical protein